MSKHKTQNLAPQLRFKEFGGEWEGKKYDEIYSFFSTNSFSRDKLNYEDGAVKNIHYGDIHTKFSTLFEIEEENVPFLNVEIDVAKVKTESYCLEGDLVIADASEDYNDIGKTIEIKNLAGQKIVAGLHTFLARPKKNTMALGFAAYLLQSWKVRKQIMLIAQGIKVLGISKTRLANIKLIVPPLPEQQKIASFLTQVDKKIAQLSQKAELLAEYKKAVMQQLFSQKIRFKDEEGKEFPKWEEKMLGELTYKTGTKNRNNIAYPIYSINNKEGFLPQSDQFDGINSQSRGYDITLYKIIKKNTFAYNPARINVGSIGFSGELENIIISSLYVCFKTSDLLEDTFLIQYLSTFDFNKSVLRNTEGGVRDYLFYTNFSNIKIPLPSNKEQTKIANFLQSIDEKQAQVREQLRAAESWKKGLLQQLFV